MCIRDSVKDANRSLTRIVEEGAATLAAGPAQRPQRPRPLRVAIRLVNGRKPINSAYTGKVFGGPTIGPDSPPTWTADVAAKYPNGVRFTGEGFPDVTPCSLADVKVLGLIGNRAVDAGLANEALAKELRLGSVPQTPESYLWHHVEDGTTMMLVAEDLHSAVRHIGGGAVITGGSGR